MSETEAGAAENMRANSVPVDTGIPAGGVDKAVSEHTDDQPLPWKMLFFVAAQVLVLAAGGAWAGYHIQQDRAAHALPKFQKTPFRVGPIHDDPAVIADDKLGEILWKLRPRFRDSKLQLNHVDHALRFWGVEAAFDDPQCFSGAEMRDMLLDHRRFEGAWGKDSPPFLLRGEVGVRTRVAEGAASASHVDHTLATMAEVGTPLDYPVVTARGDSTMSAVLSAAMRDFSLNQAEYEWSTLAFALYGPSSNEWFTTENQKVDFSRLARRIMRQELPQGTCYGNHRLYTLAVLLRLQETRPFLSDEARAEVVAYLKDVTQRLVKHQKEDGSWDGRWSGNPVPTYADLQHNPLGNRILATGHALEWWAIAPAELLPPRETLHKASKWLVATIDGLSDGDVERNYTFLSHAGRALSLWRKQWPADVVAARKPREASDDGK
jgi:hypothetical protein